MSEVCTTEQDAFNALNEIPPAMLESMIEDPELLAGYARGRLAMIVKRLADKVMYDPEVSIPQYNAVVETLRKVATPQNQNMGAVGTPLTIQINIPQAGGRVIEHGQ